MTIESPRLDDLTFDRTVEELIRRIPVYAPEWTDHNASDPGISFIHLVAHVAEQVTYRLNRVPEKNHIEFLKLLGVRLQPAHAARTRLALLLNNPSTLVGDVLQTGARARAQKGDPPPTFETDADLSIVPAESTLVVTTKNPFIDDVLRRADGTREAPSTLPQVPNNDTEWLTVVWDGKTPKLKDMPIDPVMLRKRAGHSYLWIGLDYNHDLSAGFRTVRVTLSIQLDDDEQPAVDACVRCTTPAPTGEPAPMVDWLYYFDAVTQTPQRMPGRVDDRTGQMTRSGEIRFTVPLNVGPVARWTDMRPPATVGPFEACLEMGASMRIGLSSLDPLTDLTAGNYATVLDAGVLAAKNKAAAAQPPVAHPLDPALRANAKAWFRITLPAAAAGKSPRVRIVSFNTVSAVHATTVLNELIGRGDGRPGQSYSLAHRNVLPGTLVLEMQEDSVPTTPLVRWSEVESLDGSGPFDSVYELDPEAGVVGFGDGSDPRDPRLGTGGRIPPLVPNGGEIVARRYRYGGGLAGEIPVASIKALETAVAGVSEVVNYVAATGGRDAETLDEAKRRARKELSTRSRAVTAADFEWIARQTPDVRVARAHIVPLRRPLPSSASAPAPPAPPRCGPALPPGPLGLATATAPGVVTVVVVPEDPGAEPLPTPSFLLAVCLQLDAYRLVTTEAHVVAPQYCHLCNVLVKVRAKPGYTRARLQQLVEARLGTYLHVLRGGNDGTGFPFGAQVHIADLMAQVFRTEGVDRVEDLSAEFTRSKSHGVPREGQLVLCPTAAGQVDRVALGPEENVSIDVTSIAVSTVV